MRPVTNLMFCTIIFVIVDIVLLLGHASGQDIQGFPVMAFNMSSESVATAKRCKCSMDKCIETCCKTGKCHAAYMYSSSCSCYCGLWADSGDGGFAVDFSEYCPIENVDTSNCLAKENVPWATTTPEATDECFVDEDVSADNNPCMVECIK